MERFDGSILVEQLTLMDKMERARFQSLLYD